MAGKIRCLVVDDESPAQKVLEKYISAVPSLHLIEKCNNALDAISFLHKNDIDILFLDINMPELSGLDMLKTLATQPKVILTTAYSEYALEGYEYGVIDYLLKPIPFERFLTAVNRAISLIYVDVEPSDEAQQSINESIILKQDNVSFNVKLNDILYIEAYGNYLNVFTAKKKYMIREKMHVIEEKLPGSSFQRVHKSYIISLNKLTSIEGNRIKIGTTEIPLGSYYKANLDKVLNRK